MENNEPKAANKKKAKKALPRTKVIKNTVEAKKVTGGAISGGQGPCTAGQPFDLNPKNTITNSVACTVNFWTAVDCPRH